MPRPGPPRSSTVKLASCVTIVRRASVRNRELFPFTSARGCRSRISASPGLRKLVHARKRLNSLARRLSSELLIDHYEAPTRDAMHDDDDQVHRSRILSLTDKPRIIYRAARSFAREQRRQYPRGMIHVLCEGQREREHPIRIRARVSGNKGIRARRMNCRKGLLIATALERTFILEGCFSGDGCSRRRRRSRPRRITCFASFPPRSLLPLCVFVLAILPLVIATRAREMQTN